MTLFNVVIEWSDKIGLIWADIKNDCKHWFYVWFHVANSERKTSSDFRWKFSFFFAFFFFLLLSRTLSPIDRKPFSHVLFPAMNCWCSRVQVTALILNYQTTNRTVIIIINISLFLCHRPSTVERSFNVSCSMPCTGKHLTESIKK